MEFLSLEFVNSRWYLTHRPYKDPLENAAWLVQLCAKWSLVCPEYSDKTVETLKKFRSSLFDAALECCHGKELSEQSVDFLARSLKLGKFHYSLVMRNGSPCLEEASDGSALNTFICRTAKSFMDMLSACPAGSIKECANPDCDWIFCDDSKNRSRKWCDNRCASLIKVRRYRARAKKVS